MTGCILSLYDTRLSDLLFVKMEMMAAISRRLSHPPAQDYL